MACRSFQTMKPATFSLPCGCINLVGHEVNVHMCPAHEKEFREVHVKWMLEHRQAQAIEDIDL